MINDSLLIECMSLKKKIFFFSWTCVHFILYKCICWLVELKRNHIMSLTMIQFNYSKCVYIYHSCIVEAIWTTLAFTFVNDMTQVWNQVTLLIIYYWCFRPYIVKYSVFLIKDIPSQDHVFSDVHGLFNGYVVVSMTLFTVIDVHCFS